MYNEKLTFNSKGKFKIMQIADVQECVGVSPDTLKLLSAAIEKEKPDLIVFTGDQIYGLSPSYKIGSAEENLRTVIQKIIKPAENAEIPFAVTYGNHDSQCGIPNCAQADIYAESPFFVGGKFRTDTDKGTYAVPLYSQKGEHVFDIFLIDSNGQKASGEYLPVSAEQLNWFKAEREKAYELYGKYMPAIIFQHIPLPEYYKVLKRVKFGTKTAVEAFRTHKHEFYVLPEKIKNAGGFMLESPAVPDENSGEFDCLKEKGNVLAVCVGHDHNNSFVSELDGIKLIYTQCAGFNVYGPKLKRGVRIINLDASNLTDFETHTLTFDELCADKLSSPLKEFVLTHIPTSMEQIKRLLLLGAVTLSAAGFAAVKYISSDKRKNL